MTNFNTPAMTQDVATLQRRAKELLADMDVPTFKRDVSKPNLICWLVENLAQRNSMNPNFKVLMEVLLALADKSHAMKKREIQQHLAKHGISAAPAPHPTSNSTSN